MQQTRIRPMTESGILSAVAIVMIIMSVYLPVLGVVTGIIWPVPLTLLGVRHGYTWSLLAVVITGLVTAMVLQPLTALQAVLAFGGMGVVLGHAIRQKYHPLKTLLVTTAASLTGVLAVLALGFLVMGINPLSDQLDMMTEAFGEVQTMYRTTGLFNEEQLTSMAAMSAATLELLKLLLPGLLVLTSVVYAWANLLAARVLLRRLGTEVPTFPPFTEWHLPRGILYAGAVVAVMFYWGHYRDVQPLDTISANLGMLLLVLFFLQGLSLFYYLADKYNLSRLVKGIILFLTFTNGFCMELTFFAGLWDVVFDYRRLRSRSLK